MDTSQNQIEEIFEFVRSHKVKYADVQIELVDHLASAIEILQKENPSISFKDALLKSSSQFDVKVKSQRPSSFGEVSYKNGFKNLVKEKELHASTYLNRRMKDYLKSFFSVPKVLLTIGIWIIIYMMLGLGFNFSLWVSLCVIYVSVLLYWGIKSYTFQKEYGKFLSIRTLNGSMLAVILLCCPYPLLEYMNWLDNAKVYYPIIISSIFAFLIISVYIVYIYFTDLLISEVKEKYLNQKLTTI